MRRLPPVAVVRYTAVMAASDRQPGPQFPAPTVEGEPAPEGEPGLLPPPSIHGQEVAASHLADEHGIEEFELDRHIYRGGPRLPSQALLWEPSSSVFQCTLCGHRVWTGEYTEEMLRHAQAFDSGLQPFLVGAHTPAARNEIARRYLAGELGEAILEVARRTARRRTTKQGRPTVEHRVARVQAWLLERFVEHGVLERVIEEALELQHDRPEQWALVCDKLRAAATLRRDWQRIPAEQVEQAKREHARRRS